MYALTLVPNLVPTLYTGSEVSSKLINGSDLFLQGVIRTTALEPFLSGSIRSVSVPGNPVPFAVGSMAVSSTEAVREGWKGRGLTLMHSYGDLLWGLGPKSPNYEKPNAGFSLNKILPIETDTSGVNGTNSSSTELNSAPESATEDKEERNGDTPVVIEEKFGALDLSQEDAPPSEAAGAGLSSSNSSIDIDPLLEAAVLGGLKSVTNAELPLQFGDFYQKHMLPLRPEGVIFDFKASKKYKKLSKLLDVFEKKKVLTTKVIRKQDHISAVDRTHPILEQWKGMPKVSSTTPTAAAAGSGLTIPIQSSASSNNTTAGCQGGGVKIEYLYKPPTSLRPLFTTTTETCIVDKERLFSEAQVASALTSYASTHNLIVNDGTSIKLDNLLATSLWGKKEGPEEGSDLAQGVLLKRLLSKLQEWHRILRPCTSDSITNNSVVVAEVVRKGPVRPLSLIAEKRRGRNVTAISHVETFGWTANEIERDFQRRFKTACSVSKLPGKQENDYEILMQGDLLVKVEKYLKEVEGIPTNCIQINNKLSGKKK